MKAGTRLALYAAALVALFIGAYAIAGAIVPDNVVKKTRPRLPINRLAAQP